jgi:hypothetical protein
MINFVRTVMGNYLRYDERVIFVERLSKGILARMIMECYLRNNTQ